MTSSRRVPIGQYALIGDTRSAALVAPDGAIDWWCLPRFDSPPVFGRLIGGEEAGWFGVCPAGSQLGPPDRSYRPDSATLVTTWRVGRGQLALEDRMVAEVEGRLLPPTVLVRRVTATGATVQVAVEFMPRFGYDHRPAARSWRCAGWTLCQSGPLVLAAAWTGPDPIEPGQRHVIDVAPGSPLTVVLCATGSGPAIFVPAETAVREADRDERGWQKWAARLPADLPHRDLVARSLITLQLLTYSPSGAPVAAPTTSLPEELGGARNWDYRYAWPRDASIGVAAFLAVGKRREAQAFLAWLLHASRLARPRLPVLFTLDGRAGPPERLLDDWPGYAGSRPVRVGNGAAIQHQLDGYGWVVDAAWALTDLSVPLNGEMWRAVASFTDHVAATWRLPDAGIWERRRTPAHHVHSKLMGWLALDRAERIAVARGGRGRRRTARWRAARDALAEEIRVHGFDKELGTYTGVYGETELDAALLLLPVLEFEPAGSARIDGTIRAIREGLGVGGPLLYRYDQGRDGLPGHEGAFLPCSFWLVQALARTGHADEATGLFEALVDLGGPLGLFAEEADPLTGEQLGNFPQALTHAALIQAALALRDAKAAAQS